MFICNHCTTLLHEDVLPHDVTHRIHILVKGPTARPSFGEKQSVQRRVTPPTSYADKVVGAGGQGQHTSNQKDTPTTLEQKSSSQPPTTYRPLSISAALQPLSQATPSPTRPFTRFHELSRFRLFTCLSSSSCHLFPAIMTYNAHNDAKTTNM